MRGQQAKLGPGSACTRRRLDITERRDARLHAVYIVLHF
jgi:hypothetical protein